MPRAAQGAGSEVPGATGDAVAAIAESEESLPRAEAILARAAVRRKVEKVESSWFCRAHNSR